ncbi:Helix-loop-helix DNA-binding domain protein [Ostertagia ostertagi]
MTDEPIKKKQRRLKANGRERQRMHGLNDALDVLRQELYLGTQRILETGRQPSPLEYAHQLSIGLSQTTTNMLANLLTGVVSSEPYKLPVQPRLLLVPSSPGAMSHSSPTAGPAYPQPLPYDYSGGSDSSFDSSTSCYRYNPYMG